MSARQHRLHTIKGYADSAPVVPKIFELYVRSPCGERRAAFERASVPSARDIETMRVLT
jgi:hypothetical protein